VNSWIDRRKRLLNETFSRFKSELHADDPPGERKEEEQSTPTRVDKYDELRKLMELKQCGALTDEEFQSEKSKLLASD
jgi:Short C-terminal domain